MLLLTELIDHLNDPVVMGDAASVVVRGITQDSRQVKSGYVFVAISGTSQDGARYVSQAVASGAMAVVVQAGGEVQCPASVVVISVANPRLALAQLAAAFYPSQPQHGVAVTGTNGKTSTAEFYRQLWEQAGRPAASMGTLGLRASKTSDEIDYPQGNTSPDPVLLHRTLSQLVVLGVQYVAVEASSHGLHQHRLDGMTIEAAAFTNLTHDHLDYHTDMEAYFAAKARLFCELPLTSNRVLINADDSYADRLIAMARAAGREVLTFGCKGEFIALQRVESVPQGLQVDLRMDGVSFSLALPLYGAFQAYNLCSAAGLAMASGMSAHQVAAYLPALSGVRGRMERVAIHATGAPLFVDYAHTPDALENVLKSVRPHCAGKVHLVFGCGGDRDATKRPIMGAIAARDADVITITDDNPRSENAAAIRAQIAAQCPSAIEVADRRAAIAHALSQVARGDVLVVAGKGHEAYQIIGDKTHHFDDAETIREVLHTL